MTFEHETPRPRNLPAEHADHAPLEAWDAIAAGYAEHVAPGEQSLSAAALRLVGLRAGETFLDVAAGPGGLGLAAARLGATVLATDWAPQMVAQFESRARTEGLTNASARVMDAHALDLEDDRFDVTGSQFGVMLVPDQALALREMVRVTKPGRSRPARGLRLARGVRRAAVLRRRPAGPSPPTSRDCRTRRRWSSRSPTPTCCASASLPRACGTCRWTPPSRNDSSSPPGQEAWDWMVFSNPITEMILDDVGVSEDDRARMRTELDRMIRERANTDDVAVLTAPLNIGWGRKATAAGDRFGPGRRRRDRRARGRAGPGAARPGLHRRRAARVRQAVGWASTCPATRCEPWPSWASPTRRWPAAYPCVGGSTATVADGCCSPWTTNTSGARSGGRSVCATATCWTPSHFPRRSRSSTLAPWLPDRRRQASRSTWRERRRRSHVDFVIGADGVHSAMREAVADDALRPSSMTGSSWRFVADNPGVDCWTAWSGRDETFLLIPVEEGRVYGYAARTRGGDTGSDPSWLAQAADGVPGGRSAPPSPRHSQDGELHHAAVDEVRLKQWHSGRLVLIGDAAHATGPVWAQGVAMALEDALVLGELLALTPVERLGRRGRRVRTPQATPGRARPVGHRQDVPVGRAARLAARRASRPCSAPGTIGRPTRHCAPA